MFQNPYKKQYDSLMAKHFAPHQPGNVITAPTEDWINSAKKLAKISSIRGWLLLIVSYLTYVTVAALADQPYQGNYVMMASMILTLASAFNYLHAVATICGPLGRGLEKLSNGSNCHNALALIEKYDTCREYQAQVLAQGREFIEFDYQILWEIAERHPDYQEELDADAACKKLHGLAQSPAT